MPSAAADPTPAASTTISEDAALTALTDLAAAHGRHLDPHIAAALAGLIALTATELRSEDPDDCRWVVTEGLGHNVEGRDSLAEALHMAASALTAAHDTPAGTTIRRSTT